MDFTSLSEYNRNYFSYGYISPAVAAASQFGGIGTYGIPAQNVPFGYSTHRATDLFGGFGGFGSAGGSLQLDTSSGVKRFRLDNGDNQLRDYDQSMADSGLKESEKKVDPFAPECSIPLPFQLGDEYYGPTSIWKRNERERHRVRCVNEGYERLRYHLPLADREKRLSKVETLRLAIRYIRHMELMLTDAKHAIDCDCNLRAPDKEGSDSGED